MADREVGKAYPELLKNFRKRRNESDVLYSLMNEKKSELNLEHAESCLSIGAGLGEYDIQFIKLCMPNLKKFIAIESNEFCAKELNSNIQAQLPHIDKTVYQESIQNWDGPKNEIDVILIFHMLYDLSKEDRINLMQKCFQNWLKPSTGVVVVIHMSDDEVEKVNVMQMIYREMEGWSLLLEAKELKEEIRSLNLVIHPEYKYKCIMNLQNLDVGTLKEMHSYETQKVTSDIDKLLKKIAPDGYGQYIAELFVIRNPLISNEN
ncbi:uncharacterized protein LOC100200013 [Hydra vulgaris]|uniref:Uncharacterized protein LOC100200013 n=1 Tax=Hydra vulgaris TaxID=6087 RepID=A0ABM4DEQ3_HYDVU